jgi:hypothetical protein
LTSSFTGHQAQGHLAPIRRVEESPRGEQAVTRKYRSTRKWLGNTNVAPKVFARLAADIKARMQRPLKI